ncbi:class I SAM-dependent methyltransferase [Persicobacter psychrovividus]|uniref:Methyltransferase type 11 n=1 Tax=Persicobacter psychrovividus TaxID=387638 RepID=A0ABN6L8X0_9BACT|nr:methyltransferase type 11 [Persicobacter psychrovividus]
MTYLDLIIDLFKNTPRQGPGSTAESLQALALMDLPNEALTIADIGCGSGNATLTLAQNTQSKITAVDLFPEFLDQLKINADKVGLIDQIKTLEASMDQLPFEKNTFDVIWSEGAIYNIGFKKGTKQWRKFLKPKGYLAVSEITWTTNDRPKELNDFWNEAYPEIDTAANKIKVLEENGYRLVGYFYLKPESWIKNYYEPLALEFDAFLQKHDHSEDAKAIVKEQREEIELYKNYQDYYSYGFYVAQKIIKTPSSN